MDYTTRRTAGRPRMHLREASPLSYSRAWHTRLPCDHTIVEPGRDQASHFLELLGRAHNLPFRSAIAPSYAATPTNCAIDRGVTFHCCGRGGIGLRDRFRFYCPKGRGGSSPPARTHSERRQQTDDDAFEKRFDGQVQFHAKNRPSYRDRRRGRIRTAGVRHCGIARRQ
jgi:hypothetical protein